MAEAALRASAAARAGRRLVVFIVNPFSWPRIGLAFTAGEVEVKLRISHR
jgi:hypothetical protein